MNKPGARRIGRWWRRLARGNRWYLLLVLLFSLGRVIWLAVLEEQLWGALVQAPADGDTLGRVVEFYWDNGMPTRGVARLNRLADAHPDVMALRRQAGILMLNKAWNTGMSVKEALAVLEQANPTRPREYFDIGSARWHEGDYEGAAVAYEQELAAAEVFTDTSPAWVVSARWYLADAYKALGKTEQARELLAHLATDEGSKSLDWAAPYKGIARAEIHPAEWRVLTVTLTSDHVVADYRQPLTADVIRDVLGPTLEYDALASLLGGVRANSAILGFYPTESAEPVQTEDGLQAWVRYEISNYRYWWWLRYPQSGSPLAVNIYLPLSVISSPITFTVAGAEGVKLVSFAPPPDEVGRGYARWYWHPESAPPPIPAVATVEAEYDPLTLARLDQTLCAALPFSLRCLVFALVPLLAGAIYIARRQAGEWARVRWSSLALDIVGGTTLAAWFAFCISEPMYFAVRGGEPLQAFGAVRHYYGALFYLGALVLSAVIIPAVTPQPNKSQVRFLRHLGALCFVGYFAVQFTGWPEMWWRWLIALPLGPVLYYLWLAPNRPAQRAMCGNRPAEIVARRTECLRALAEHLQVRQAARLLSDWPRRIAEGEAKVEEYENASAEIRALQERTEEGLKRLADAVGLEGTSVRDIALATGPYAHPWQNGLAAILGGSIPYLFFLILARSVPGKEWWWHSRPLLELVYDFIGMAWGPGYLFFFGYFYWWLRGRNGLQKGLSFAVTLVAVLVLPNFLFVRSVAAVGSQVWEAVRIFVTFAFCGLAVDVSMTGRRRRQLLQLYDSPTLTALGTVLAGAATTLVTGVITGTLGQIVSLAVQFAAEPIGALFTGVGP